MNIRSPEIISLTQREAQRLARYDFLGGEAHQNSAGEWGILIDTTHLGDWSGTAFFICNSGDFTFASRDSFLRGEAPLQGYNARTGARFGD